MMACLMESDINTASCCRQFYLKLNTIMVNDKKIRFKTYNVIFTKGNNAADGRPVMGFPLHAL